MKLRKPSKLIVGLLATIFLLSGSLLYVLAQTPTSAPWISSGSYPSAYDYTIFTEGGNYFAKNNNGRIMSANSNASIVFSYCLASGSSSVFVKSGTYDMSAIVFIKGSVRITGECKADTILQVTGAGSYSIGQVFRNNGDIPEENYITIENLYFDCSGFGNDEALHFDGANYVTVRNCIFRYNNGTNRALVSFNNMTYSTIENCVFEHSGYGGSTDCEGIYNMRSNYTLIKGNRIVNMSREAIYIDLSSHVLVVDNYIAWCDDDQAIDVKPYCDHIIIQNNLMEYNQDTIYFTYTGTTGSTYCSIIGNTLRHGANGIIGSDQQFLVIANNVISNFSSQGIAVVRGTPSGHTEGVTVIGNQISDCLYNILLKGAGNTTVSGNSIRDGKGGGMGIYVGWTNYYATFNVITGNSILNCPYGIIEQPGWANFTIVDGCTTIENGNHGILLSGAASHCSNSFNGTTYIS